MKARFSIIVAVFMTVVAVPFMPMVVVADDEGHLHKRIRALEAEVATLTSQVQALTSTSASLLSQLQTAQNNISTLQTQLANLASSSNPLQSFVTVETGTLNGLTGPHIIFTGANVHIRSGSGHTDDNGTLTGLGSLVVGYNEACIGSSCGTRGGSHNLIIGRQHSYSSFAGLVSGEHNNISGQGASVSGGTFNTASGQNSNVSGGDTNTASGVASSISGGEISTASGQNSNVSGGHNNTASGDFASVSGGENNTASGIDASVSGGFLRSATGTDHWAAGTLSQNF